MRRAPHSAPVRLLLAAGGLLAASCAAPRPIDTPNLPPNLDPAAVRLRVRMPDGKIGLLALNAYVRGAILPEADLANLDRNTARQVAQIQAILARTYAMANLDRHAGDGFDLCATTHCQVYGDPDDWPAHLAELADEAARSTTNVVVTHAGRPINAVFHADCGGHTSDAGAVWRGASPPYLRGAPDTFCARRGTTSWRFETTSSALERALDRHERTRVGGRLDALTVTERDAAGRAVRVTLRGQRTVAVRGEHLRAAIVSRFGPRSIRSTRFTVRRDGAAVTFEGRGFGHGVGLCQKGAAARASAGHSPQAVLEHYYPSAVIAMTGN